MARPELFRFFDLEGKTLLITGVTRGIGKALLPGLLEQGLNLAVVSRGMAEMQAVREAVGADGSRMRLYDCDLAQPAAVEAAARQIREHEPALDAMLHNAAIDPRHRFEEPHDALWSEVWQVNLRSAATLTQRLLPQLRQSAQGRVIFTGSVMSDLGGSYLTAYASSKGALQALTRALAHELQGTGITVNCLVPGAIQVERETSGAQGSQRLIGWQAVPRRLVPADLLGPLCLLLSQAGGAITGQSLTVDGGLTHPLASPDVQGRHL